MRTLLVCALLIVLCHSPVWSDDDAELQKAKAAYAEAASKQTELMKAALEREVTKISRTGKLKLVQEIQQEQADFVDKGKLPESAAMKGAVLKYKKALDTARERQLQADLCQRPGDSRSGVQDSAGSSGLRGAAADGPVQDGRADEAQQKGQDCGVGRSFPDEICIGVIEQDDLHRE